MLHSAVSGLGLYCFPVSHKKEARLIWVSQLQQSQLFSLQIWIYLGSVVLNLSVLNNRFFSFFACGDFSTAVANSMDQDQDWQNAIPADCLCQSES